MLMHYHPGAFIKGKWNCCIQCGRTTLGCQPTYHLLTRSSSRYAQMRRKDTLASSTNSQRQARAGSRGSHAFMDRRSVGNSNAISTDVEDTFGSDVIVSPAGRGLSNSYVELSRHPPHTDDIFALSSPSGAHQHSRRSSKNSTEPSIGVGTMTLSHVSISEISACGEAQSEEASLDSERQLRNGNLSQSQRHHHHPHHPHHYRSERGRKGGRSQVAPSCTAPISRQLPEQRHSYELELRTLPRSFKSRSPAPTTTTTTGLNNSWNASSSSMPPRRKVRAERTNPVGREGEEPTPVAPPRVKKGSTSSSAPYSPSISSTSYPSSSSSSQQAPPPLSLSSRNITDHSHSHQPASLKHSNTFAAHPPNVTSPVAMTKPPAGRTFRTKGYGFSRSMGALAKPLIEPKVSASNPNVIHV